MLRSKSLKSNWKWQTVRAGMLSLCLTTLSLILLPSAFGQTVDFTLTAAAFSPVAINPGGTASSNITIGTLPGFAGTVALSCQVTPQPANFPNCQVSPATVAPPAGAVATITTTTLNGSAPPGLYSITVTGTDASGSVSAQQDLTVLAVTPQFTIDVLAAVAPSSVHAGSGGTGMIEINPITGYAGTVTLSCSSITPLVTIPPVCSFDPAAVTVGGSVSSTSTISITTVGPIIAKTAPPSRIIYAFWLTLPMLTLTGLGAAVGRKRSRSLWGLLSLFVLAGLFLLIPACGNSTPTGSNNTRGVTPSNSYTFTLLGVDANGNTSSNTSTGSAAPSVTLTVD